MNDNIDTDQILPKQFLSWLIRKVWNTMYAWLFDDQYTEDPALFNKPEYRKAAILITGDNLGLDPLGSTQPGL